MRFSSSSPPTRSISSCTASGTFAAPTAEDFRENGGLLVLSDSRGSGRRCFLAVSIVQSFLNQPYYGYADYGNDYPYGDTAEVHLGLLPLCQLLFHRIGNRDTGLRNSAGTVRRCAVRLRRQGVRPRRERPHRVPLQGQRRAA